MGSVMEENKPDNSDDIQKNNEPNPDERIPLWLQGLEDSHDEASPAENVDPESGEGWVNEPEKPADSETQSSDPLHQDMEDPLSEDTEEVQVFSDLEEETHETLPDWFNEISHNQEESQTIEQPAPPVRQFGDALNDSEENPDPFIDITEEDLKAAHEVIPDGDEALVSEDEALPDWLNEMIAEETPSSDEAPSDLEDKSPEKQPDQPTEPVDITQETPIEKPASNDDGQTLHLEHDTSPVAVSEIKNEADVIEAEEQKHIELEPDTLPIPILDDQETVIEETDETVPEPLEEITPAEVSDSADITAIKSDVLEKVPQEEPLLQDEAEVDIDEAETVRPLAIPKTLRFAKYFLDQGDHDRALEILNTYIEQETYLDEINTWLKEAASTGAENDSLIWESLGDISIRQGNPQSAIDAYAKAIETLLKEEG